MLQFGLWYNSEQATVAVRQVQWAWTVHNHLMKTIDDIQRQLSRGEFEFSRHAFKRAVERNISDVEIMQVGEQAKIIEVYPDDKYAPSCLLLGFTAAQRPLHLQVS